MMNRSGFHFLLHSLYAAIKAIILVYGASVSVNEKKSEGNGYRKDSPKN